MHLPKIHYYQKPGKIGYPDCDLNGEDGNVPVGTAESAAYSTLLLNLLPIHAEHIPNLPTQWYKFTHAVVNFGTFVCGSGMGFRSYNALKLAELCCSCFYV